MKKLFLANIVCLILLLSCSEENLLPEKSSTRDIISFTFESLTPAVTATIDSVELTISATLPVGTDLTKITPTIEVSDMATVSPASGVEQDFSNGEVNYTITAQDGSTKIYTAQINVPEAKIENNSLLYFGAATEIYSLNAQNGEELKMLTKLDQCCWQSNVPITYADEILFANDYYGDLHAIDSNNGAIVWTFEKTNVNPTQPPLIHDNIVYYSTYSGLYALDSKTGDTKWQSIDLRSLNSNPTIFDGTLFVGTNSSLGAVDTTDGSVKWEFRLLSGGNFFARPVIANQTAFIGNTNGNFYAIDTDTGTEKWNYETANPIFSTAKFIDGVVYFGSEDSYFYALDAETGELKWRFLADGPIASSPTVENGVIYFTGKSKLYSLRLSDGIENVTYEIAVNSNGRRFISPVIANGVIYITNEERKLEAINAYTGEKLWERSALQIPIPIVLGTEGELFVSGENGF